MTGLFSLLSEWVLPGPRRSVGTPYQTIYNDPAAQLTKLIEKGVSPVYMSVNPYSESGEICAVDRLFFDFDSEKRIRAAYDDAVQLNQDIAQYYNLGALTLYSGSKGYHVHVFLEEPVKGEEKELKGLYGELQRMITTGTKYPTLDLAVIGDIKRLARVPYSKHQKTGDLCAPVTIDHVPEYYKLNQGFSEILRRYGIKKGMVDLARRNLAKPKPKTRRRYKGPNKLRPCIEATLAAKSIHDPEQIMNLAAVAELLANGQTEDQIIDRFREMEGFSESKTRYFVRHSVCRGYKPHKCETIQKNRGCQGSECPIYKEADPSESEASPYQWP